LNIFNIRRTYAFETLFSVSVDVFVLFTPN